MRASSCGLGRGEVLPPKASEGAGGSEDCSEMVDVSALQASIDHLRALNTTLVELREGQRDLEQAVRVHRERLRDLLQEPGCQGCAETLRRAHGLELGADFSKV